MIAAHTPTKFEVFPKPDRILYYKTVMHECTCACVHVYTSARCDVISLGKGCGPVRAYICVLSVVEI